MASPHTRLFVFLSRLSGFADPAGRYCVTVATSLSRGQSLLFSEEEKMALLQWLKKTSTRSTSEDSNVLIEISEPLPGPSSCSEPASVEKKEAQKTKVVRKFKASWTEDFDWLELRDGKLFCSMCTAVSRANNAFGIRLRGNKFVTKGSVNMQRNALERHQASEDHAMTRSLLAQRRDLGEILIRQEAACAESVTVQFNTAIFMATDDVADRKFLPLLALQKKNGVAALQNEEAWYKGHCAVAEMQQAAADVCQDTMKERLQKSQFVGVMLDESLDIAVQKRLVICFKLVDDGMPAVQFGRNMEVKNGKAATILTALRQVLNDMGIPVNKVIGLGTDGASVMVGCKNGVTTAFKVLNSSTVSVWCCAHRLSLVCHWAAQSVPALKRLEDTLVRIHKYFKYSAVRVNDLKSLKSIMAEKVKKFKKPTSVRWLSLNEAVTAAHESWGCLVLTLEHETTSNQGDTALALSLLKEVKTYAFISLLCLLRDVLGPLTTCSKTFQRDIIDVDETSDMLQATLESLSVLPDHPGEHLTGLMESLANNKSYQGISFQASDRQQQTTINASHAFVQAIDAEVARRFPKEDMAVLKALNNILNPKKLPQSKEERVRHGERDLTLVIESFHQIEGERAMRDYMLFKCYLHLNRQLNLQTMCTKLIKEKEDQFPDFVTMANISLVIPLTSVPCERAFSAQNSLMDSKRNRMSIETLNNKMLIKSEARKRDIAEDSVRKFNAKKNRTK